MDPKGIRVLTRIWSWFVLAFLYVPLLVIVIYAFNKDRIPSFPPDLFTLHWFRVVWSDPNVAPGIRAALANSLVAGIFATLLALVLGTSAAFAIHRYRFFGREAISFAFVLPIALPGIVTALALSSMVDAVPFIRFGMPAIIVGHATFCVVVIFNNVIARLRRTSPSIIEASMDLGADGVQTFWHVTLPTMRTALVAGALLAFGLSFDEIVVTLYLAGTKQTLPLWIYNNIQRPVNLGAVYVVGLLVLLISIIPVFLALRLARDTVTPARMGGGATAGPVGTV
ncbi:MAG: ABC transporter permease [Actinobacteria bacterium]|nr:MAG: ABC transporter permease [Actinomycetota bacterium]